MNKELLNHIRRIQGQLDGVEKMMRLNKSCAEVVMQLSAVQSSTKALMKRILEQEAETCIKSNEPEQKERLFQTMKELFKQK